MSALAIETAATDARCEEHWNALFGLGVSSTNRLPVLLDRLAGAPSSVFWPVFLGTWTVCDRTWEERRRLLSALQRHVSVDWLQYATPADREFFNDLPSVVTVYRGCSRLRARSGMAWTTDRKVAEGFARGHRGIATPSPVVATARVFRPLISCAFTDRSEAEVLIEPRALRDLVVEPYVAKAS